MLKIYRSVGTLVQFLAYLQRVLSIDSRNIVFVIVSQTAYDNAGDQFNNTEERLLYNYNYGNLEINDSFALKSRLKYFETVDSRAAKQLKNDINEQVMAKEQRLPIVHITNEDFPISGAWTIIPLLIPLLDKYENSDVRWVLFIEPHTVVKYPKLLKVLAAADRKGRAMWIGYPLCSQSSEANKQYNFKVHQELVEVGGLPYPYFASGFAMRIKLIHMLVHRKANIFGYHTPTITDASFEFACYVYGNEYMSGPLLEPSTRFCAFPGDDCATYPRKFDVCGEAVPEESIYFAVKTYHSNHNTSVKILKRTWGQYVSNLMFYSDIADPSLPGIDTGVPNVKFGHCLKTLILLKHAVNVTEKQSHIKWIILIDDDALLGVQRLCEILSCYQGGENLTMLGERYRIKIDTDTDEKHEIVCQCRTATLGNPVFNDQKSVNLHEDLCQCNSMSAHQGYFGQDFITGGSGIVLSIAAARLLAKCQCQFSQVWDDFMLGSCATVLGIPLSHSPLFHQFFPEYYQQELLERDRPVSFHGCKSQNISRCYDVYDQWFKADDLKLKRRRSKEEL